MTLLSIQNLKAHFHTEDGAVRAVNGVDLDIEEGEKLGLIGETGCGKTVLGLAILRLLSENTKVEGRILYKGQDLLTMKDDEIWKIRGREIAMIFQNPLSSMNPVLTVGTQVAEPVELHQHLKKQDAMQKVIGMLKSVKIPLPQERVKEYPHEFSGGMRQRAMIAMGLICMPSLIIADEPTTGLDVTIQAQIMELMRELLIDSGTSMLLITHDLAVAAELCDHIAVMYPGEIVEYASVRDLFKDPKHPYTRGFLNSLPARGLKPMAGTSPSLINLPAGCKFHPRCSLATERCRKERPELINVGKKHYVRCFLYD
ncbi:MAG: ABC transporter ATP-binding protein [ANME-2 cluster archaeon]|jgi:peptide/nickel transport system ATP-binding protein|nr:ABC transporter ATP-binding protein [ANME-2 cluster archaeon]